MKKNCVLFFLLLSVSGLAWAQCNFAFTFSSSQDLQRFLRYDIHFPPYVHAHRGGGYADYPENCIATFDYTLKQVPAFMEIDPRVTKDGVIVLMHDATLNRTTTGTGKVSDYTYAELGRFFLKDKYGKKTDYKIPTLEEALRWAKGKSVLIIDKKDVPISRVLEMIKKERAEANVILMAYTVEDAKKILMYDSSLTLQVFVKNKKALDHLEQNDIPWTNVVAFVNHAYPEDYHVLDLLHQRNVKTIVGTSRNLDIEYARGNESIYDELLDKKIDIIEADSAVTVGKVLIRLLKDCPIVQKYITFNR